MNKEEQCELIAIDYLEGETLLSDALLQAYNTGYRTRDRIAEKQETALINEFQHKEGKLISRVRDLEATVKNMTNAGYASKTGKS